MTVRREWTSEELSIIANTRTTWPRRRKLTDEQINEIRRRVDSLTTPYSINQLAKDFGVTPSHLIRIARRQRWAHRTYEPSGVWWLEQERAERKAERERRRALEEKHR